MADDAQVGLDTSVSHSARIWNYWLGGKDNFAVDREAGDRVAAMLPIIVAQARADRSHDGWFGPAGCCTSLPYVTRRTGRGVA